MIPTNQTFTLNHPVLDGPFVFDYFGSESGARAWASLHILRTFDVGIPTAEWEVEVEINQ